MSSPICISSSSIERSSTSSQTKTRPAKKNLQDRWSASIIPSTSSSEETDSHSTDSLHTTTKVTTRVLKKEQSTRHKWTKKQKDRLWSLLDKKESPENIQLTLKRELGMTYTVTAIKRQLVKIKNPDGIPTKTFHRWTKEQKDRLWSLSKEGSHVTSIQLKPIQLALESEFSITLTKDAVRQQLTRIKKFNRISTKTRQMWTEEQANRLWSLSTEGKTPKTILSILKREFKVTFTPIMIENKLIRLRAFKGMSRTPRKKWSQDDLKILKTFLQKNSLTSQKGSVEKSCHSHKKIIQDVNPEEWQKLATTLNRTAPACLKAAYCFTHTRTLTKPSDSYEEASHLTAAAPKSTEELDQFNADFEKLLDRDPGEFSENEPLEVEDLLDLLDSLGDNLSVDSAIDYLGIIDRLEPSVR